MTIECARCGTQFRFDDSGIEKDGVWVRCSRCQHVFFQNLPQRAASVEEPRVEFEREISFADAATEDAVEAEILARTAEFRRAAEERERLASFAADDDWDEEPVVPEDVREEEKEPLRIDKKEVKRRQSWVNLLFAGVIAVVLAVAVYILIFPQVRQELLQGLARMPIVDRLMAKSKHDGEAGPAHVALKEIRQRTVSNWLLGNVRIIEGAALNRAAYPLTRISIRGELYDAAGTVLAERASFCGNYLSDQELATMTEEEIQRELSQPLGSDIANDRIEPGGQIPFMIVFAHEPPNVAKATVVPVTAERLLP